MTWILHLETSTDICSVALGNAGVVVNECRAEKPRQHINQLSSLIDRLLDQEGVLYKQLSAIAISTGPGSYTGLRVGYATAKGLSMSLGIPLIDVSTMFALAYAMKVRDEVNTATSLYMPLIDARRMEAYLCGFNKDLELIIEPCAQILDHAWLKRLIERHRSICFGGNAAFKIKSLQADENVNNSLVFSIESCNASLLVSPAWVRFIHNEFAHLAYSEPFYLKPANITKPKKSSF